MKRRDFLGSITAAASSGILLGARSIESEKPSEKYPELARHKISEATILTVDYHWPRFVGKNGWRDVHGQNQKSTVLRIRTDQGAEGWGLSDAKAADQVQALVGKTVVDIVNPQSGLAKEYNPFFFDFALFDLMGVIEQKPVYQLLGAKGTKATPVYSGMIYIDELPYKDITTGGIDKIMDNCAWDYNYGYRQLKIKIGRGKNWYPPKEGMEMDVKVYRMIDEEYRKKGVDLLVDSNNAYTLQDTISFMEGIGGLPLFWMEEPFPEQIEDGKKLREWMNKNGFAKTRYADGEWVLPEANDIAFEMAKQGIVNTYLNDIHAIGMTNWLQRMPILKKAGADASPHAWGQRLKTNYTVHLAAGLGNISTVEGVTCFSDDIDYGHYPIKDGKISVSEAPGFGMKLLRLK
jgi:L-alanine-DL-glutamate epimerase-like enolase superfamily enzyme